MSTPETASLVFDFSRYPYLTSEFAGTGGTLRRELEDFQVEELPLAPPAGTGEHLHLFVEKRDLTTRRLTDLLRAAWGLDEHAIGHAGLKDRRAVTRQWLSVPATVEDRLDAIAALPGVRLLDSGRHPTKLQEGQLAGNRFRILLRDAAGDAEAVRGVLAELARRGVPNYFGPQRFGRDGANLAPPAQELSRLSATERSLRLSAARSVVFNALLAVRVGDGSWERLLAGDLANLDGRGSIFPVAAADGTLEARCARLEIHPTGPLWGAGEPKSAAGVRELEMRIGAEFAAECARCAAAGMSQERRSLRLRVTELSCEPENDAVLLRFRLTRGSFATAVLRELVAAAPPTPEDPA